MNHSSATGALGGLLQDMRQHPVDWGLYTCIIVGCLAVFSFGLLKKSGKLQFLALAALINFGVFLNAGDDYVTHVFRVAMLHDQLLSNYHNVFVVNKYTSDHIPVFLYYSIVPYVVPVALTIIGIPAAIAYKMALAVYFDLFALAVWKLSKRAQLGEDYGSLFACLFIASNYIACLWLWRSAFAEIFAFSLVPWVVLAAIRQPQRSFWIVTSLLALQMAAHPIVFAQCALAEFVAAITFLPVWQVVKANILPAVAAFVLSCPFWAPQALYLHAVMGSVFAFADSFQTAAQLLNPAKMATPGLWVLAAMISVIVVRGVTRKAAIVLTVVAILLVMQTVYAEAVSLSIPLLSIVQFVWRWMSVTCFLILIFLLSASKANLLALRILTVCAALNLVLLSASYVGVRHLEESFARLTQPLSTSAVVDQYFATHQGDRDNAPVKDGLLEYTPDYSRLKTDCAGNHSAATYASAQAGVRLAEPGYVAVSHAPIGFVRYRFNNLDVAPVSACNENVLFGPFPAAGVFRVDESLTEEINLARYAVLALLLSVLAVCGMRALTSRASRRAAVA